MIVLHCGWAKTGTTSLQAALAANRASLADAGVIYPRRWQGRRTLHSHNALVSQALQSKRGSRAAAAELAQLQAESPSFHVLVSIEKLAACLARGSGAERIYEFVTAVQAAAPVTCIWTLRRYDEVVCSLFGQRGLNVDVAAVDRTMRAVRPDLLLAGTRKIADLVDGQVSYVKYRSRGDHNVELLKAIHLPREVSESIARTLRVASRSNVRMGHKEAAALANVDELSARFALSIDRGALVNAFDSGFRFADDAPCVLGDPDAKQALHEKALRMARRCGFLPYLRFFESTRVETSPVSPLALDALTDADLRRLTDHFACLEDSGRQVTAG